MGCDYYIEHKIIYKYIFKGNEYENSFIDYLEKGYLFYESDDEQDEDEQYKKEIKKIIDAVQPDKIITDGEYDSLIISKISNKHDFNYKGDYVDREFTEDEISGYKKISNFIQNYVFDDVKNLIKQKNNNLNERFNLENDVEIISVVLHETRYERN